MATTSTRETPHADPSTPDLSRLRIPRDRRGPVRSRGFPWKTLLLLLVLAGVAWLFRDPLLRLVRPARGRVYETARVAKGPVRPGGSEGVAANGYVVADRMASVATVLSGRLVEIHAQEGDVVEEGSVLARLQYDDLEASWKAAGEQTAVAKAQARQADAALEADRLETPRLEAIVQQAEEQVAEAAATLELLERDVARNRPLFEKHLIDEGAWDAVQSKAEVARQAKLAAEAGVRVAEAARDAWRGRLDADEAAVAVAGAAVQASARQEEVARITLEKTKIRAPFRGLVVRKDAELGEVIAPTGAGNSRGSVFTIVDPDSMEMQVELSERRIHRVHEGDAATVFLDADPDKAWPGRVRKIWPRADRTKGTIEVRVALEKRPPDLRPEMAGRVVFAGPSSPGEIPASAVTVPERAVIQDGDRARVFVVEGGRARARVVKLGRREGDLRVVEGGLAGGEEVLLDPPAALEDGSVVETEDSR